MKKLMFALMLTIFSVSSAFGATYTTQLDWNDNVEVDLDGYNVYEVIIDGEDILLNTEGLVKVSEYTVSGTVPDNAKTTLCWAVTAVDTSNNESLPSEQTCETFDTQDTTPPDPPTGLINTLVELIVSFFEAIMNFFA
jgi:hypothetical protein